MPVPGLVRNALVLTAATLALGALPQRAAAQEKVYSASELTTPASVRSKTAAANVIERGYPAPLKRVGGKVQLQFVVGSDGRVEPASVKVMVATVSALGDAAVESIRKVEFNPGEVDGKPVRSLVIFPVVYAPR